jgi:hypothetical protein
MLEYYRHETLGPDGMQNQFCCFGNAICWNSGLGLDDGYTGHLSKFARARAENMRDGVEPSGNSAGRVEAEPHD